MRAMCHRQAPRRNARLATRGLATAALTLAAAMLGGCNAAKQTLRADFTDFNAILQQNQTEQMLLNLVRMHYREAPLVLQAGSLTASYENTVSTGADATLQESSQSLLGLNGQYTYSSKPTISYTPVEGKAYVEQLMAEITPRTFALLVRAGCRCGCWANSWSSA